MNYVILRYKVKSRFIDESGSECILLKYTDDGKLGYTAKLAFNESKEKMKRFGLKLAMANNFGEVYDTEDRKFLKLFQGKGDVVSSALDNRCKKW